ncbi:MAG: hypothetical protein KGH60_01500 [Candidatus Micrarchaeota archaeon]|nr:hypothetical protein [Candidatus Micrarchaeota archaeon]
MHGPEVTKTEDNNKPGKWKNFMRQLGSSLNINSDERLDGTGTYLKEKGIISKRHNESFNARGIKVKRISAIYEEGMGITFGSYTIRMMPAFSTHWDSLLVVEIQSNLAMELHKNKLLDKNFTQIKSKPYFDAGYLEITITCTNSGAYERVVPVMNYFLEECIKAHETQIK